MQRQKWWEESFQKEENIWFALTLIVITETALYIGANIIKFFHIKIRENNTRSSDSIFCKAEFVSNLRKVSMIVFYVTMLFYLIEQFEPLIKIGTGNYLDYYTNYSSSLPGFFHTLASFARYSICVFLATLPEKKKTFIPLSLYVLSTIPSLLIGVRNPAMLSLLFVLSYYLLRDFLVDDKKWIGKIEKGLLAICTPALIIFMGVYAYIRSGLKIVTGNFLTLIADFSMVRELHLTLQQ